MPPALQPIRGTRDIIGDESARHLHVVEIARRVTTLYGFLEWQTPIFEDTRVFSRTLGETSDVVSKEMYSFEDRGGDSLTLRPEGTAGVCRALISNGLTQTLPQKVFYQGPMFRYERPQKGRYRQFHQIGIEVLGHASPIADAEAIACAWQILCELGLEGQISLNINTLGDAKSRENFRTVLVDFFEANLDSLSEESRFRLYKNPLRILDSKDHGDRELISNAPRMLDHLTFEARKFYEEVLRQVRAYNIHIIENPKIVRGLDYYNHTTFEFVTDRLGAQGTVLAGGRYDGLVEELGGPRIPGVGWAAGIERLAMLLITTPTRKPPLVLIRDKEDKDVDKAALDLAAILRGRRIAVELAFQVGLKAGLKFANRIKADWAVLVLPEHLIGDNKYLLKNLRTGFQTEVDLNGLISSIS